MMKATYLVQIIQTSSLLPSTPSRSSAQHLKRTQSSNSVSESIPELKLGSDLTDLKRARSTEGDRSLSMKVFFTLMFQL